MSCSPENRTFRMLTTDETEEALLTLVKAAQRQTFQIEIKKIEHSNTVPFTSNLKSLAPFIDELGLLRVNELVLIKDSGTPPHYWPLGRILKLHPGVDGQNRVATILSRGKEIARSMAHLCPLSKDVEI
ncbi:hypothetical protein Trydic_g17631 [Trypoxylus dichotomus]